jgi:acyl carrier protein
MTETTLLARVQTLIAQVTGRGKDSIRGDMKIDDLVTDSIELFRLIMAFEEEFQERADYRELMKIETVADIITYLERSH